MISDASDGEDAADFDINNLETADDEEEVTVHKASAKPTYILRKAPGNKSHKTNRRRGRALPKKSNLLVGEPIRFLAAKPYQVVDQQGKVVCTIHGNLNHQANKPRQQYQIKKARTYEHYFSNIPMDDGDGNQQPVTYEVGESIKALINGGANGGIGGENMTLIGFHPEHKKVNVRIAGQDPD